MPTAHTRSIKSTKINQIDQIFEVESFARTYLEVTEETETIYNPLSSRFQVRLTVYWVYVNPIFENTPKNCKQLRGELKTVHHP